jgi:hypothetical protein
MADIVGKPEGLTRVKECLNYETNIDTVLDEKMLQFKFPAAHSVRFPAGEAQGFTPYRPHKAWCHIWPRRE